MSALLVTLPVRLDAIVLRSGVPTLMVSVRLLGVALVWLVLLRLAAGRGAMATRSEPAVPA